MIGNIDYNKIHFASYCAFGKAVDKSSDEEYARKALAIYMSGNGYSENIFSGVGEDMFSYMSSDWKCRIAK